jgi:tetratricopeptide (TPR) repeat protein
MTTHTTLAALAAVLIASACAPTPERTVQDYLAATRAAVSDYQRGKHDLSAGNYGLALARFSDAVRRDPADVAARNGQAIALAKLGRDEDAVAAFEQALNLDARSPVTLGNYANFLEHRGNHAKAAALVATLNPPTQPQRPSPPVVTTIAPTQASPAPVAVADVAAPGVAPKPALVIANASGEYRLARRLQQYLSGHGYAAERVANAARFDRTQSVLFCHAESREAAEDIRRALPANVRLVVLPSKSNTVELVAGSDLNGFDAPAQSGTRMVMR